MMPTVIDQPKFRRPGRPMKIGKIVSDSQNPGRIGVYVGTCTHCNDKVILPREAAEELVVQYVKDKRSYCVRLMKYLMGLRSI